MAVVFFFAPPLVGHLLRLNGWPCQSSHHSLTQSHSHIFSLCHTHTLRHKLNPISDMHKNRLFLCQPLSSCSAASGRCYT